MSLRPRDDDQPTPEEIAAHLRKCKAERSSRPRDPHLTQEQRERWLRRAARKEGMTATKLRGDGLWRFVGEGMTLEQAETRLAVAEAESYLRQAAARSPEA